MDFQTESGEELEILSDTCDKDYSDLYNLVCASSYIIVAFSTKNCNNKRFFFCKKFHFYVNFSKLFQILT